MDTQQIKQFSMIHNVPLNVYDINGENLKQYTVNKSNDFAPIWTADDFIYFCSDRGAKANQYQIWRFKIKQNK